MDTTQCIFCKIIARDIPSYIVYEDDICIGFLDIAPITRGHTLIVPKVHYRDLQEFDSQLSESILIVLQRVSRSITVALGAQGIQILQNNGADAGQVIFHIHWHIIPRYHGEGVMHWQGKEAHKEELHAIASALVNTL